MIDVAWGPLLLGACVALAAPAAVRPLLLRAGAVDVPSARSSHAHPTLRGGGLASLLGMTVAGLGGALMLPPDAPALLGVVLGSAAVMGLVGLAEDVRGLSVRTRFSLQLAVGGAVGVALALLLGLDWGWVPAVALLFAAHVNVTNFMDGVNGISSLHGLAAGGSFALLGAALGIGWLVMAGLTIAVAFVVFLPWNLIPPGLFLGDAGSYLLGAALAATSLTCLAWGVHPLAAVAPLLIYWSDAGVTLARRALQDAPLLTAHRTHTYQRLASAGWSHLAVGGLVAALTAAAGAVGLLGATGAWPTPLCALVLAVVCSAYLALPRLIGRTPR